MYYVVPPSQAAKFTWQIPLLAVAHRPIAIKALCVSREALSGFYFRTVTVLALRLRERAHFAKNEPEPEGRSTRPSLAERLTLRLAS